MMDLETFLSEAQKILRGIKINVSLTAGFGEVGWRAIIRVVNGGACDVIAGGETAEVALKMLERCKLEGLERISKMQDFRIHKLRAELAELERENGVNIQVPISKDLKTLAERDAL